MSSSARAAPRPARAPRPTGGLEANAETIYVILPIVTAARPARLSRVRCCRRLRSAAESMAPGRRPLRPRRRGSDRRGQRRRLGARRTAEECRYAGAPTDPAARAGRSLREYGYETTDPVHLSALYPFFRNFRTRLFIARQYPRLHASPGPAGHRRRCAPGVGSSFPRRNYSCPGPGASAIGSLTT